MQMQLYKIVNRELVHIGPRAVPDGTRDLDAWLKVNGYGSEYTLRRGIVQKVTPAEREALQREHDRLKAAGKLPSAFDLINSRLGRR